MATPRAELVRLLRQRYMDMGDTLTRQAAEQIEAVEQIRIAHPQGEGEIPNMALGKGKYDDELSAALRSAGAKQGILIVLDGRAGRGFACQTTVHELMRLPEILESIAAQIRQDRGFIGPNTPQT